MNVVHGSFASAGIGVGGILDGGKMKWRIFSELRIP